MFSDIHANTAADLMHPYGMVFVGVIVSSALWGMTCVQTNKSDGRYLGAMVVVLWMVDTVHLLFCVHSCWKALIPQFGDLEQFSEVPQGLMYQLFATDIVTLTAQVFFIWRIWRFSLKTWIFPLILIPLTAVEIGACIYFLVEGLGQPASFWDQQTTMTLVLIISLTGGIVDIMTAVILGVMLWRSRTGLRQSDRMIFRLMGAAVGTGFCTAIFYMFLIIVVLGWPHYHFEYAAEIPLATVYCNAVLALLNSRDYFRGSTIMVDAFSKPLEMSVVHTQRIGSLPQSAAQDGGHAELEPQINEGDIQE